MTMKQYEKQLKEHALEEAPLECCGVVVLHKGKERYIRCRNISRTPTESFIIHPEDRYAASKMGEVVAIAHSHPTTPAIPSSWDIAGQKQSEEQWIIYSVQDDEFVRFGDKQLNPLYGREYLHQTQDCYTFVRDWYKQDANIILGDYVREDEWWHKGENHYLDNYEKEGFYPVPLVDIQYGDLLLITLGGNVPNHGAIYIGNNKVAHHPRGRLSSVDVYGSFLMDRTALVLRHKQYVKKD